VDSFIRLIFWNVSDIDQEVGLVSRHAGSITDPSSAVFGDREFGSAPAQRSRAAHMLDTQNQGPQCMACGSPMKLSAIEPSALGHDLQRLAAQDATGLSGTSSKVP
jgi:hypothetical protein